MRRLPDGDGVRGPDHLFDSLRLLAADVKARALDEAQDIAPQLGEVDSRRFYPSCPAAASMRWA
ncbi:MAG: hypothetical protein E6J55_00760 [Deltaproteobacteria bacterium]|nr:MAG: hypothetical protein E6J55_00760 [Deltaproteobacteria bacterium]